MSAWEVSDIWFALFQIVGPIWSVRWKIVSKSALKGYEGWKWQCQTWTPKRFPFREQLDLAKRVRDGGKYHAFAHPPGWGKTIAATALALHYKRTLFLVRPALMQQQYEEVRSALQENITIGIYDRFRLPSDKTRIVFSSTRLNYVKMHYKLLEQPWDVLICDETLAFDWNSLNKVSKILLLNANFGGRKKKQYLDWNGVSFYVHFANTDGEDLPKALSFDMPPVEIIEVVVNKKTPTTSMNNIKRLQQEWYENPVDMTDLDAVAKNWQRVATVLLIGEEDYMHWLFEPFLLPEDHVLYLYKGKHPRHLIGITDKYEAGVTLGEKINNAIAKWQAGEAEVLNLTSQQASLGYNLQYGNVLITQGIPNQYLQYLGRLQRRGQQQAITWIILQPYTYYGLHKLPLYFIKAAASYRLFSIDELPPPTQ